MDFSRGRLTLWPDFSVVLTLLAGALARASAEEQVIRKGSVVVLPLSGEVTEAKFFFLRRILKSSEAAEASA